MTTTSWKAHSGNLNPRIGAAAPWASRIMLVVPALVMLRVSIRYIFDPIHAASTTGVALTTPEALTDTRVVGGLTLTIVIIILSSLFSRRRLAFGHATVATMMALILTVRMFGFVQDGTTLGTGDQRVKTIGEIVFLTLNTLGFFVQIRRANMEVGSR